jgi:hypothetical protein
METYLSTYYTTNTDILDLYTTLLDSYNENENSNIIQSDKQYEPYLSESIIQSLLKSGQLFRGFLRVNKYSAAHDAYVNLNGRYIDSESGFIVEQNDKQSNVQKEFKFYLLYFFLSYGH